MFTVQKTKMHREDHDSLSSIWFIIVSDSIIKCSDSFCSNGYGTEVPYKVIQFIFISGKNVFTVMWWCVNLCKCCSKMFCIVYFWLCFHYCVSQTPSTSVCGSLSPLTSTVTLYSKTNRCEWQELQGVVFICHSSVGGQISWLVTFFFLKWEQINGRHSPHGPLEAL